MRAATAAPLRYSAVVEPDADVPLSFRIPGYVVALMQVRGEDGRMRDLAEGDRVRKGAVLVRIRPAEYEDRVRQAKAQAAAAEALATKARLDFDRATRLYGSDSMTKPDFDAAQAQHDATQSELRAALAQTSEAESRSPIPPSSRPSTATSSRRPSSWVRSPVRACRCCALATPTS